MKLESAAVAKGHRLPSSDLYPREGTRTRAVYDLFQAHKGEVLNLSLRSSTSGHLLENLRNSYGLDIRCLSRGRWVLAGEWFGPTYRDYIADRLAAFERGAAE